MNFSPFRLACAALLVQAMLSLPSLVAGGEDLRREQPETRRNDVPSKPEVPAIQRTTSDGLPALPPVGDNSARLNYVLNFAREAATRIDNEIRDYTCILIKRERVDGEMGSYQYMHAKIRHAKKEGDNLVVPFSVLLTFLKPERMAGREVLFIENQNQGDLIARRGGRRSPNMTVQLPPDSPMAMDGNRYPVNEIGFQNLAKRLIEVLENEQAYNDGVVEIFRDAKVDGRKCTHFRLTHPTPRPELTYYRAEVSVDDELGVPVYFRSFDWPAKENDPPRLLEEYYYKSIKLNVGLTDWDFDMRNPEYHFQLRDKSDESLAENPETLSDDDPEGQPTAPATGAPATGDQEVRTKR
ncbi:MAG: DUF1571 domain-containing protein [Pirellulaceae bacterium]